MSQQDSVVNYNRNVIVVYIVQLYHITNQKVFFVEERSAHQAIQETAVFIEIQQLAHDLKIKTRWYTFMSSWQVRNSFIFVLTS